MEAFEAMPRMQASELAKRAENYAGELVQHLEKLNAEYFQPEGMSEQTLQELRQAYGEQLLGSPVHTYYDHFQRLFCEAIAEHYLIVPD